MKFNFAYILYKRRAADTIVIPVRYRELLKRARARVICQSSSKSEFNRIQL